MHFSAVDFSAIYVKETEKNLAIYLHEFHELNAQAKFSKFILVFIQICFVCFLGVYGCLWVYLYDCSYVDSCSVRLKWTVCISVCIANTEYQ